MNRADGRWNCGLGSDRCAGGGFYYLCSEKAGGRIFWQVSRQDPENPARGSAEDL